MSKPKTVYSLPTKTRNTFARVAKNTTAYMKGSKVPLSYALPTKPDTSYNPGMAAVGAWFLNSTFLTLADTTHLLLGYSAPPNTVNTKIPTSYAAV